MSIGKQAIQIFKQISKIPRQSNIVRDGNIVEDHESKILDFLQSWAKNKKLTCKKDAYGNMCIFIPWTFWREKEHPVILQGHMDMVCIKDPKSLHNFETDPIDMYEENGWLKARGTTLWADNGMWISLALACCDAKSHPPLEILITATEETWMVWASQLDASMLSGKAKYMINLDSEELWEITIGCSGGGRSEIYGTTEYENIVEEYHELYIFWWKWWHSWIEIHKNRANVLFESVKFLHLHTEEYSCISLHGGQRDNAIPSEVKIQLTLENEDYFLEKITNHIWVLKELFDEPNLDFRLVKKTWKRVTIKQEYSRKIFEKIIENKTGVQTFSQELPWLVETSLNLWVMEIEETVLIKYATRSSKKNEIDSMLRNIEKDFNDIWLHVELGWIYPGWLQKREAPFVKIVKNIYDTHMKKESKVLTIHAWLECGVLKDKLSDAIEIVSIWPNILWAHTVEERCEIDSVITIWNILEQILLQLH